MTRGSTFCHWCLVNVEIYLHSQFTFKLGISICPDRFNHRRMATRLPCFVLLDMASAFTLCLLLEVLLGSRTIYWIPKWWPPDGPSCKEDIKRPVSSPCSVTDFIHFKSKWSTFQNLPYLLSTVQESILYLQILLQMLCCRQDMARCLLITAFVFRHRWISAHFWMSKIEVFLRARLASPTRSLAISVSLKRVLLFNNLSRILPGWILMFKFGTKVGCGTSVLGLVPLRKNTGNATDDPGKWVKSNEMGRSTGVSAEFLGAEGGRRSC